MNILYVEDNPLDIDLTQRALASQAARLTITSVTTLAEAYNQLNQSDQFDVVLLDLRLPDGHGLELLQEVRRRRLPLPVVILTGSGTEETAVSALKAGADNYLIKRTNYLQSLPDVLTTAYDRFQAEANRQNQPINILYVEHNSTDIDLTRRHFTRHAPHLQLTAVHSVDAALNLLPTNPAGELPCDVLLLDYKLPGLNALEGLKIVREERHLDVPVVLVTGEGNEEIAIQALRLGASDYLIKHRNYLYQLPVALENAHYRAQLEREHQALQESEARFRRLAENVPDIIFRLQLRPAYEIKYLSPAVTHLTGYTPADFYTKPNLAKTIIKQESDYARLVSLVNGRYDDTQFTLHLTHRNGRPVWLEVKLVLIHNDDGEVEALEGVARDVTDRTLAENERTRLLGQLQEQAMRLNQILDTVPEGVLLLGKNNQLLVHNPTAATYLKTLQHTGDSGDLTHLGNRPLEELLAPTTNGLWHEIHDNGRIFETIAQPLAGENTPHGYVIVIKDVTTERTQRTYQQSQAQLATVGRLAAGIAHDFNNVLAIIVLYAQILQKSNQLSPTNQEYVAAIFDQTQHAVELIDQILDFSRRPAMGLAAIDLLPLMRELVKLLQRILPTAISMKFEHDRDAYLISGDATRLKQALMNLVINAKDAMPHGGELTLALTTITVADDEKRPLPNIQPGQWIQLTIRDTGTGILPEHLPRLFEPFFTTKEKDKGTGLGLAQVHGIITQHNGSIDVQSTVGTGTTFTIYLPAISSSALESDEPTPAATPLPAVASILVVDENELFCRSLVDILTELGYTVETANHPTQALTHLSQNPETISLVICDWIMPEMNAATFIEAIVDTFTAVRVLIMAGYPPAIPPEVLQLENVVGWIKKPFSLAELGQRIQTILSN